MADQEHQTTPKHGAQTPAAVGDHQRLQEKLRWHESLHDFTLGLLRLGTQDEVTSYVADYVVSRLGFENCDLYLADSETGQLVPQASAGKHLYDFGPQPQTTATGSIGRAAAHGKLVNASRSRADGTPDPSTPYPAELAVPLLHQGKVIGVIASAHIQAGYFTTDKEQWLLGIASLIAGTIANSATLKQMRQTVEKVRYTERLQRALFAISSLLHKTTNMQEFYEQLHAIIGDLMYARNFYIALHDKINKIASIPYFRDLLDEDPGDSMPDEVFSKTLTYRVMNAMQPVLVGPHEVEDLDRKHDLERYGTTPAAWLGVPFMLDESTNGIIVVQSYLEQVKYTQKDKEVLSFVAQHLSATLKYARAQEKIQHQALHDLLTGLANRSLFLDRLQHLCQGAIRSGEAHFAVMYIDLDDFKAVNDSLGHHTGDLLLCEASRRISRALRQQDTVARIGGDEFALILENPGPSSYTTDIAARIIHELEQPFSIEDNECMISASIGIVFASSRDDSASLIKQADAAMYQAKQLGRGRYCTYNEAQKRTEAKRVRIRLDLRRAIRNDEFFLHYQPIVELGSGRITGLECLVRWQHPQHGLLAPDTFIPVAETSGIITELDLLVLQKCAVQMAAWRKTMEKHGPISLHVNFSGRDFADRNLLDRVRSILAEGNIDARRINIELTESALVENIEPVGGIIDEIHAMGMRVVLDDFGTGYSSLNYLHRFSIDTIKIDKSFVMDMAKTVADNPIISTVMALADTLKVKIIAEGIEQKYQLELLQRMGCRYGQGYLLSKPIAAEQVPDLLANGIGY